MNTVVTQNDIKSIVDSIVSNTNATSKIIEASVKSITTIISKYDIKDSIKGLNNIVKISETYSKSVDKLINAICTERDNKNLSGLLGRIKEYDEGKKQYIEKYTVVDAVAQLPAIFNSMFSVFEKLNSFKTGFFTLIKFRMKMATIKSMISELITDFINMFGDIDNDAIMSNMLKYLIKQPDTIKDMSKTSGGKEENGVKIDPTTIVTKVTHQGQLGLLDIFEKTFALIGLLNNLNVPALTVFKFKLFKVRLGLTMILKSLTYWTNEHLNDEAFNTLDRLIDFISGKKNSSGEREGGLDEIISNLSLIVRTIKKVKISIPSFISIVLSIGFLNVIFTVIKYLDEPLSYISDEEFINKINNAKNTFNNLTNLFGSLTLLVGYSVLLLGGLALIPVMGVFLCLIPLTKLILWVSEKSADITDSNFGSFENVINEIKSLMIKLTIIIPLSVTALIGLGCILVFLAGLVVFSWIAIGLSKITGEISNAATKNIVKINRLIESIMLVGLSILILAVITPIIIKALTKNIMPFLGVLLIIVIVMAVTIAIAKFISKKATKSAIQLAINIAIIAGCFILAAMTILVAGLVGQQMKEGDSIINILIGIAGIIAVSVVMIGLGIALSFAAPFIGMASIGITPLVAVLALMLSAGLTLVALGNIKLEFGQYTATDEDNESKTYGIKGNVGKIINFTKFLKDQLKSYTKDDKKAIKQGKRLIRQVQRTVRLIKKIAEDFNSIQKISLDKELITANIENMFAFIATLDVKISEFVGAKTATNDELSDVTAKIKGKKKKMRKANKMLNKVEKVITTLNNIGTAISSIQEFKLTSESRKEIESNVSELFLFISSLDGEIVKFMAKTETNEDGNIVDTEKMSKREWKQANKKLSKVEKVIATIQSIGDALNTIKELGFGKDKDKAGNDKVKTAIIANVTGSLESIDEIAKVINGKSDTINIDETKLNNATKIIDYIQSLNNGFKGISETDPNKIKTNLDNYVKFVEKVNTIDVSKVETTANLFKQMSKFSNSIKGDFDRLAESLSDKLLPVLTELKEIMSEVPGKLDIGFQNTSASIAATNAAPTKENVAAQVSRENPNLSRSDVDAIVATRLNERARNEANGMSAKLDELISLLKGMSGETAVVKMI